MDDPINRIILCGYLGPNNHLFKVLPLEIMMIILKLVAKQNICPKYPKIPLAPWVIFCHKKIYIYKERYSNLDNTQLRTKMCQDWKNLKKEKKTKYINETQRQLKIFSKQELEYEKKKKVYDRYLEIIKLHP